MTTFTHARPQRADVVEFQLLKPEENTMRRDKAALQYVVTVSVLLSAVFVASEKANAADTPPDVFEQNKRLGRGGNLGNILYRFKTWDKKREMEHLDLIKGIGMNGVRINTGPFAHVTDDPPYTLSAAFFERLDWTVKQALSRGLTVIIDNHEYHAMADDPMGKKEMFLSTWDQIARHYKDYPDSVFLGILNEPNRDLTPDLWNLILADAIKVIRKSNPNRTLVIGPGNWNNIRSLQYLKLPEDDRNIIVEIHYYSPHRFTHQGASWSAGSDAWLGTTWRGTPEEKKAVVDDFNTAAEWAKRNNRPLYLGEFGAYRKADTESRVRWLSFVVQQAEKNDISWAIWDLMGTSFGIYDESKKSWIEPLKDAILPPQ
jgi:endoglucanase